VVLEIPFDNNTGEKYVLEILENEIESGDGVVLKLNKRACIAFSEIFKQLANSESTETHIHIGYDEEEPQGPGFRIELSDSM